MLSRTERARDVAARLEAATGSEAHLTETPEETRIDVDLPPDLDEAARLEMLRVLQAMPPGDTFDHVKALEGHEQIRVALRDAPHQL